MPARKRQKGLAPFNTMECRAKIRATQLIHRLQAHIFDGLELSMSQIKAIDILLKKIIAKYGANHLDLKALPVPDDGSGNGSLQ
jgi:hypothetical protein